MTDTPGHQPAGSWIFDGDRQAVGQAREAVRRALAGRRSPPGGPVDESDGLVDDAVLVVSELVGNAVTHGTPPIELTLAAGRTGLVGTVTDHGPGWPCPMPADDEAGHGRGLLIVTALTYRWGVCSLPGKGKRVWFQLREDPVS
ncbi:hypothetical protein Sru01_31510 [Sphaerisporangium rufum]|uniref:Histidine kinase/HSP90-like ATPase domain-containing protein n=1 Tax=Sphaerisporangium rufum TaxID=1381558 RepID=A0A919R213_9ACTN|nr:ATP-binding protein [Sphaerisporangium rufum]GII78169.1 hypothetical protein Sru01_31510 [Sphaerisporangium rufum]